MAKLDDIRRAVEQRQQAPSPPDPASSPRERPPGSRPYVAQMGDVIKDGLLGENQRLKAEREGGMVLLRLDPKQIGRTEFANRHDLSRSAPYPTNSSRVTGATRPALNWIPSKKAASRSSPGWTPPPPTPATSFSRCTARTPSALT